MEIETILTAISTMGFPIVCCGALFWYITKKDEQHKSEIDELRKTVETNTNVLTELITIIKGEGKNDN